jgi:LPS-assembly lipoprotein
LIAKKSMQRAAMFFCLALSALALSACGWEPLYSDATTSRTAPELAAIKVQPIKDHIGQLLEWSLREGFNPDGLETKPKYTLHVVLTVQETNQGVEVNFAATRGIIHATAEFTLSTIDNKRTLYRSRTQSLTDFNIIDDAYASMVAQGDAEKRAVRDISDEIQTRLALFLRDHPV